MNTGVWAVSVQVRCGAGGHIVPARGGLRGALWLARDVPARQQGVDQIETFADVVHDAQENKDYCVLIRRGTPISGFRGVVENLSRGTVWVVAEDRVGGTVQPNEDLLRLPNRFYGGSSVHQGKTIAASTVLSRVPVWRRAVLGAKSRDHSKVELSVF